MIVAVIGAGFTGTTLLYYLAANPKIEAVYVVSHNEDRVKAAIMAIATVYPNHVNKVQFVNASKVCEADIVVFASGTQPAANQTQKDIARPNFELAHTIVKKITFKPTAVAIVLPNPADDLAVLIQHESKLPLNQVIGFGGDLDVSYLRYVLNDLGSEAKFISVIGDHANQIIPVYEENDDYDYVAGQLRALLSTLTGYAGPPKSLAPIIHINRLINDIIDDRNAVHCVSCYHQAHKVYLTWPFTIGRRGVVEAVPLELSKKASNDLFILSSIRKARVMQVINGDF